VLKSIKSKKEPMNSGYLKSLRIVYFALAMGITAFMAVALLLNNIVGPLSGSNLAIEEKTPFLVTLIFLTGGVFIAHKSIIPKKRKVIQTLPTLERKLAAWRELNILQGALIEGPAFFGVMLFLLLGIYVILIWPLAALYIFWLTQPTREKLIQETQMSYSETEEFDRMN
jgi:hypothetical protein